jgi:hypothetical protein
MPRCLVEIPTFRQKCLPLSSGYIFAEDESNIFLPVFIVTAVRTEDLINFSPLARHKALCIVPGDSWSARFLSILRILRACAASRVIFGSGVVQARNSPAGCEYWPRGYHSGRPRKCRLRTHTQLDTLFLENHTMNCISTHRI